MGIGFLLSHVYMHWTASLMRSYRAQQVLYYKYSRKKGLFKYLFIGDICKAQIKFVPESIDGGGNALLFNEAGNRRM